MRTPQIRMEQTTVKELKNILFSCPKHYTVYVSYCDSLYLVLPQGMEKMEENTLYIHSMDTRETSNYTNCVQELTEVLEQYEEKLFIKLAPADNLDEALDLQMEDICEIDGISVCDICKDIYIIAGK